MELLFIQPQGPADPVPSTPIDTFWYILIILGIIYGCYAIRKLIDLHYYEKNQKMRNKIFENFKKLQS